VDRVNAQLASYETLKKFTVVEKPLTVVNGLLTATLKVRRRQVYDAFKAVFEGMYA
jgi:long-chain acyl-CoA synthetase